MADVIDLYLQRRALLGVDVCGEKSSTMGD